MTYPILNATSMEDVHPQFHNAWVDVKAHYAAVGDGVTDDSAAFGSFLAAIDNHAARGFIPAGTYNIDVETVYATFPNASNVTLRGAGRNSTIINMTGTPSGAGRAVFQPGAGKSLDLADLTIQGPGDTSANLNAILGSGASGVIRLRNVSILDFAWCVRTPAAAGWTVDIIDTTLRGVQESAGSVVHIPGDNTTYLRMRNVDVTNFGTTGSGQYHGVYPYRAVNLDLDGVRFDAGVGTGWCIQHYGSTGAAESIRLRALTFAAGVSGILTSAGGTPTYLSDSVFVDCPATSIVIDEGPLFARGLHFVNDPTTAHVSSFFADGGSIATFEDCQFDTTSAKYSVYTNTTSNAWRFARCRFPNQTLAQALNNGSDPQPVWIDCDFSDTSGPNYGPVPTAARVGPGTRWYDPSTDTAYIAESGAWKAEVFT